jgi:hypothetical protein
MRGDDADRDPPQPPDKERGVHVSRDSAGAEGTGGRPKSKLGFRVQAQRRAKGDDPVFDNIREPAPPPEPAAPKDEAAPGEAVDDDAVPGDAIDAEAAKDDAINAEAAKEREDAPSALERVMRFFLRGGSD